MSLVCRGCLRVVEVGSDVGYCAGVVVGGGFDHDGYSVGSIAFINDLLVVAGVFFCGFLDGAFYGVLGHIGRFGVLHQYAQTRIGVGIGTA